MELVGGAADLDAAPPVVISLQLVYKRNGFGDAAFFWVAHDFEKMNSLSLTTTIITTTGLSWRGGVLAFVC